ncbi:MAG: M15 family metallopeptidase, partial [Candidatus Omnitrophica bacterium]|nr:M15 family metallopeptidase [Candidatus Omnitrophota bacterium]
MNRRLAVLRLVAIVAVWLAASAFSSKELSFEDQGLVQAFLTTAQPLITQRQADHTLALLSFDELYAPLPKEQRALLDWMRALTPQQLGHRSRPLGEPPQDTEFERLDGQTCALPDGRTQHLDTQYLPAEVYFAYRAMMADMQRDLGRHLLVESGYRSPAYQLYVLLSFLPKHGYSVTETTRHVALPGYSEHGAPQCQAIDFINQQGINGEDVPAEFEGLPEYDWLTRHAREYGFVLSYPRDNPWDTSFEPWHWHYEPNLPSHQQSVLRLGPAGPRSALTLSERSES